MKQRLSTGDIIEGCFDCLMIIVIFGALTIGCAILGVYQLSAHHKHKDSSLMPAAVQSSHATPQECRPNGGQCPRLTITVYRQDEAAFHQSLRQAIDRHGGSYAPDQDSEYYALLPPDLAESLQEIANSPRQEQVSPGYAEWATLANANRQPTAAPPNGQGVYIRVNNDCRGCRAGGWFFIAISVTATVAFYVLTRKALAKLRDDPGQAGNAPPPPPK